MKRTRSRRQRRFWLALSISAVAGLVGVALVTKRWSHRASFPTEAPRSTSIAPTNPASAGRPTLWVLAIGVSQYTDPDLRLRFPAADARAVTQTFGRQRGGPLYRDVKTQVLADAEVTRASILRALDEFPGKAAPIDVGVIYLAGHGVHDELLDNYYFLPAAASPNKPRIEGLDMDDFNRQLRILHRSLPRLVVILDTCHAGAVAGAASQLRWGEDLAARLAPAEGLYILAAAKSGQESREVSALGHGVFTKVLLDGLQGEAPDAGGVITVLGLASYAARVVPQLTESAQTPYLSIVGEDQPLVAHPQKFAQVTPPPLPSPVHLVASGLQRERVAIMNFENLRPDPQHDWMQQALGEQFATTLHRVTRFDVYDERMVRFLARGAADPIEAARRADMTKLVSGTYWVQDNRISVTAHVKNTQPLKSIASANIEGPLEQFSQLSNRIVVDLLEQLHVELAAAEVEQLLSRPATDLAARKLLFDAERPRAQTGVPGPTPVVNAEPEASAQGSLLGWLAHPAVSYAAEIGDPESELRATLEGYRRAFQREDIGGVSQYYAELTDEQKAAFKRYFDHADDLAVEFSDIQIAMIGDEAAVSFTREDRFIDHESGQPHEVEVRVTKLFVRGAQGWRIAPER